MDDAFDRGFRGAHHLDRLEHLLGAMYAQGVDVRQDWLDGAGGGLCEIAGRPTVFVDLAQSVEDQLAEVTAAVAALAQEESRDAAAAKRAMRNAA